MNHDRDPPGETTRPVVVIYTHSLLGSSMTFIASHANALRHYRAVYAGSRRIEGLQLPDDRAFVANTGGVTGLAREFLFRRLGVAGALAAKLKRFKPSVVHAHFGQSGPAGLDLAEALGVPLIVTYHGQDATITEAQARLSWRGREYLRGRRRVIERASCIIAVSDFIRGRLIEQGYPEGKVITHRNGIDVRYFQPRHGEREPIAVFVGRFVEKKGCEYLVRALAQLRGEHLPVNGILIGDGPLRSDLQKLASDVGANVTFTGFLAPAKVKEWLAKACVAVVPSVTASDGNSEGLPTVILEAQAMGTPVIATRHAGNAEGLLEGQSALLVDERDVAGLSAAVRYFLSQPAAVVQFGRRGREFVESTFSIDKQVAGLEQIYEKVCRTR